MVHGGHGPAIPQLPAMGKKSMMPKVVVNSMFTKALRGPHRPLELSGAGGCQGALYRMASVDSEAMRGLRCFKVLSEALETVEVKKIREDKYIIERYILKEYMH